MGGHVFIEFLEREPADFSLPLFAVAKLAPERREQIESDVGRLVATRVGMRDVVAE